jgi:hypothetical protein
MRTLRWTFVIAILLALLPVISQGAALLASQHVGCGLPGDEFFECRVKGHDVTAMLSSLADLDRIALGGAITALLLLGVWALSEIAGRTIWPKSRRLRF